MLKGNERRRERKTKKKKNGMIVLESQKEVERDDNLYRRPS